MPVERPTTLYLNDQEWVTVQTTPVDLHDWVAGYLYGEGVIQELHEIRRLVVEEDRGLCWADLAHGVDLKSLAGAQPRFTPVPPGPSVGRDRLLAWMAQMLDAAALYHETGGIHVSMAVRIDTEERIIREDIGRHNAVDKVIGAACKAAWPPERTVIFTSGRISYEMCARLARFGAGIGVSRTAATDQAYALAMRLGIELVGYVRSESSLTVYTAGKRIG